jgi:hypothetical protein
MSRARRLTIALVASLCAAAFAAVPARAATRFDPALRFRVLRTPHFRIYFHQNAGRLAARLAAIAEETWLALGQPLGARPPLLTHVVLADQTELANGYATPLPYNTVVIYPTVPSGSEFDTDDWLRLAFTHEFTHIVHLDRSESWARIVRHVFGRTSIAFPNLFLPTWQIEGLATYQESAMTGEGRLHAGDFQAIVEEAARRRTLEPLDRINGGLTDWPAGQAPYAYGSRFHEYLADRFGVETLAALADRTARRVPYLAPGAFSAVFGESLNELWRDFQAALVAEVGDPMFDAGATRLTRQGFVVAAPRFDGARIVYAAQTPDGFPGLNQIPANGGAPSTLATRYYGSTTAVGAKSLFFDQLEVRRNVAVTGDLYALSRRTGRVKQLTSGARVRDPDLSPDGATLVAVQERAGARDVVLISGLERTPRIATLVAETDTQFNAPRWSPDGRRVAVERHRLGAAPEIVIVDVATRGITVVAAVERTRMVNPSWRPDGRAIVAAVAPQDRPFNVFEIGLEDPPIVRPLTHTSGGAAWPEVSPDGKTLVFVGYTPDGHDLFSLPYPTDAPAVPLGPGFPFSAAVTPANGRAVALAEAELADAPPYSPLPTLRPTSWSPLVTWDSTQVRVGAAVAGIDVLGYHAYAASATWLAASPSAATTRTSNRTPDWSISYAYDRWRPTLVMAVSTNTSFFAGPATAAGTPSTATDRQRQVLAGVVVPFVHARVSHAAALVFFRGTDDYTFADRTLTSNRAAIRGAWETTTARTYGYSISPEDGVSVGATAEVVRTSLGASADATTGTVDARAYLPGAARHHVVAARAGFGVSSGDSSVGRTFLLGGASPNPAVADFGSSAIGLLRGFPAASFAGSHVALVNLEYRLPLARPQRGVGAWPLLLHTLHAAAFADAGHAWTRDFDVRAAKTSFGAELSANIVAGFYYPFTLSAGVAHRHDGAGTIPDGAAAYFRVGKSF